MQKLKDILKISVKREEEKEGVKLVEGKEIGVVAMNKEDNYRYIYLLQQKNKQLKEQLKIKDDGFTASTKELCEYATILEELKKWLEEDKEKAMCTFETGRCFNYYDILDKIKELEEGVKE